ncbi:GAF domain-containing protein [Mycetocola miduiensis]|uniref:GAF domain-containing protein n=1 Tax=Mycetocola miduiensis TaxID=995034 RepID=A0A1I4ZYR0_9MICO|nr:GAF domain-containing protein [Mycetocola miduiensis]SFN55250.1 GAF domain-containing protein [Mycetocola miduiensis]
MTEEGFLTFPEEPRAKLDEALSDLVTRASDVLATQGRLRALLKANQLISQQLDLPVVLRRIVETAIDLVRAEFGALGVIGQEGNLEQFIHVGMGTADVERIGHLPEGHGLLGALIVDPHPIRLSHLADDERYSGFPAHHPRMDSFLGVPILVGDRVFGNLYLTNAAAGEFSSDDEELVKALAATAGFAIDNARMFANAQRRQAWFAASAELTVAVAGATDDPLELVVERVRQVACADLVRVLIPSRDSESMIIVRARGQDEDSIVGLEISRKGSVPGRVLQSGKPLLLNEDQVPGASKTLGLGPTMAVPLSTAGKTSGVLAVSRLPGGVPFAPEDLEMVADLAGRVGIALELAAARSDRQHIALMEERGRIARDLHDHVIQQLFATGLELQSIAGTLPAGGGPERLEQAISHIDQSIGQIRTAVFALAPKSRGGQISVRHRIIDLVGELGSALTEKPWVSFEGPVDLVIVGALADDVLAVVRESLTNVAKHASATKASLVVAIRDSGVEIEVQNDGAGHPSARSSGLTNLRERALSRGGDATFSSTDGAATFRWYVPINGRHDA